jgi:hypothetical protein
MKRKTVFSFLVAAAVVVVSLATGNTSESSRHAAKSVSAGGEKLKQREHRPDPPGTVNGAVNPELIPDRTAYVLLLRLLAGRHTEEEKISMKYYLRRDRPNMTDDDIDALLVAADEFVARAGVLDRQAKEIKDRHWPNPPAHVMETLRQMQSQKELIADQVISSLPGRLSGSGLRDVRAFVNERVKPRTKITLPAQSPPGGPEWRPRPPEDHHPSHP